MLSNGGDIIRPIDADEVDWSQIYGVSTGCASDVDGDGIPNSLDTDSDGDDCYDANEAGFTDANDDGYLDGTGIDADGLVTGGDGYTTPADTDNSDTADYIEELVYNACMQTITFNDIYKIEGDPDFALNASTTSNGTITYTIETNSTGTSLSGDTVTLGSPDALTVTATLAANGTYRATSQEATLYIQKDTDNDGIPDTVDLDDDNDGILDTNECPLIDISSDIDILDPSTGDSSTPRDNFESYEIAAGFAAGQRTVFNGIFLKQIYDQLFQDEKIYIGIPRETIWGTSPSDDGKAMKNYEGVFFILQRRGANLRIRGRTINEYEQLTSQPIFSEIPADDLLNVSLFFEITPDGNEIRIGSNSSINTLSNDNFNATTYENWTSIGGYKSSREKNPSYDIGFVTTIESRNIMITHTGNEPFDTDEVDWSQIYGVSTSCC